MVLRFSLFIAILCVSSYAAAQDTSPWPAHDSTRPKPPIVTPPTRGGQPPSDAVILFDGTDLSKWKSIDGSPTNWRLEDGSLITTPNSGPIETKDSFGDVQLHLEWSAPNPPNGSSQARGNSGVYLMTKYEVQVLDSFNNETYADGQAAAIYGQNPPMVNACRPPGEWQAYDIIFRRPQFNSDGSLAKPAIMTVFHNGTLVQDHFELWGPTSWLQHFEYELHAGKLPLRLQDHGNPVRFRNIWLRELPEPPTYKRLATIQPQTTVKPDLLDRYVGKFGRYTITRTDDQLHVIFFDRTYDLVPQTETLFQFKHTNATLKFQNAGGEVNNLIATITGESTKVARSNPDAGETAEMADTRNGTVSDYLGLSEEDAIAKAKAAGLKWRVVIRDGQSFPATRDYRPQRLNFVVTEGKVTKVTRG